MYPPPPPRPSPPLRFSSMFLIQVIGFHEYYVTYWPIYTPEVATQHPHDIKTGTGCFGFGFISLHSVLKKKGVSYTTQGGQHVLKHCLYTFLGSGIWRIPYLMDQWENKYFIAIIFYRRHACLVLRSSWFLRPLQKTWINYVVPIIILFKNMLQHGSLTFHCMWIEFLPRVLAILNLYIQWRIVILYVYY